FLAGQGVVLKRLGLAPKFSIIMQASMRFGKKTRRFQPPPGWICEIPGYDKKPQIEVLAAGQQMVAIADHPDTGLPYYWSGGHVTETPRDGLPSIDDAAAERLLDLIAKALAKIGWIETHATRAGNSADYSQTHDSVNGVHLPLDERLAKIEYGGEFGINQAILELPIDRLKSGIPVKDVIEECMALVRSAWEKLPADHPERSRWDWNAQRRQIEASCYGFIKKECSEQPRLIDTL